MSVVNCKCPWCGHRFQALTPANLSLFTTCPNPSLLPGDTPEQVRAGGRLCRGSLARVAFAVGSNGAWEVRA